MRMLKTLAAIIFAAALPCLAQAQSYPSWAPQYHYVPTPAEWTASFSGKQDYLGAPPILSTGGTLTGLLVTAPSTTSLAGFNIPPGTAPTSPKNGDFWSTSAGFFGQANGVTVGPFTEGTSGSFTATQPLAVTFPGGGVVNYALNFNSSLVKDGSNNLGINLATPNTWSGQQTFVAPNLGTPASGVGTNLTGTASGLTAGNVTTNANLTGDVTSVGNATTLTNAPVIAKVLTGFTSGAGTVTATDSILSAFQKINGNDALKLPLAGGTMSGNIAMGGSVLTGAGANYVTNTNLAQGAAGTFKGNPTGSTANVTDFTLAGLTNLPSPSATLDLIPIVDHTTGTIKNTTPSAIATAVGSGVTSFNSRSGAVVPGSSDYTAPQIAYTPPGTGGVATTVQTELQRLGLWANDYGAVCNGSTDDHVAFQDAINEAETLGVPAKFAGSCAIATALSITATVDFSGAMGQSTIIPANTIDGIDIVTANPVYLHDFTITYNSPYANAGTQAISVSAGGSINGSSRFWNLGTTNAYIGINFTQAAFWTLTNSIFSNANVTAASGIRVANTVNADAGDSVVSGNLFQGGSGGYGIYWQSSGGLKIVNNKILGSNTSYGILFSLASGASTSANIVVGNSIEGWTGSGIAFSRQGTTGTLYNVTIANNEIGGGTVTGAAGINVPTDAAAPWITGLSITGNTIEVATTGAGNTAVGVSVDSVTGLSVAGNTMFLPGTGTNYAGIVGTHGPTATNCVFGPNPKVGTFSASSLGSCTSISPN